MKITCDEATEICDKNQYGEASLWEKVKLGFHLLLCKYCAAYSKQNNIMTRLFRMKSTTCKGETKCMDTEDKEQLKAALKKTSV